MGNPLLTFWYRMFVPPDRRRPVDAGTPEDTTSVSGPIFLVLRRMRAPLILLILIFAISVLGLTLVPGTDTQGQPHRLSFFDAFYFMSYTASTIGYGEIPHPYSTAQRIWVTFSIYLGVIGWAYAIGMMLALLQDRAFRDAVATQRFRRRVARMPEPFLLVAGYGRTGALVGRALDAADRRFVALDTDPDRIDLLDLDALRADVPALTADASVPAQLVRAGLLHERCEGVLALTDSDEANLAVVMATHVLRPGLPVIARAGSQVAATRMSSFGEPTVINPYDDFGDHLRVALRSPTSYQLRQWLTSPPTSVLPAALEVPEHGAWLVVGDTPFANEVANDLRADRLSVVMVTPDADTSVTMPTALSDAAGIVAATESDALNISVVEQARRRNPDVFTIAQQVRPSSQPLYVACGTDLVLVSAEVVAHEVLARLAHPVLSELLRDVAAQGEPVARPLRDRLVAACGTQVPLLWSARLTGDGAPAVLRHLWSGPVLLGDLLRSPENRETVVACVPLVLVRADTPLMLPDERVELRLGDELLLAGRPLARRTLATTLTDEATAAYVLTGTESATTWIGRALTRTGSGSPLGE
jgi:Trk K+ transport system NAD-binding subunit